MEVHQGAPLHGGGMFDYSYFTDDYIVEVSNLLI